MSFDVSASKQVLAFGDSDGCIHLWTDTPEATFNTYPRDSEFALPCMVDNLPHLDWNQDLMPLSLIPFPLINETLLSDWSAASSTPAPRYVCVCVFESMEGKKVYRKWTTRNASTIEGFVYKTHPFRTVRVRIIGTNICCRSINGQQI